jgi:hypothetical protein
MWLKRYPPKKTPYDLATEKLTESRAEVERLKKENADLAPLQLAYDGLKTQYEGIVQQVARLTDVIDKQAQSIGSYRYALIAALSLLNDITITPKTMGQGKEKAERRERVRELAKPLLEGEAKEQEL